MRLFTLLPLILALLFPAAGAAAENADPSGEGRPWRVIYVEAGPYRDYHLILRGLAQGLHSLKLIEDLPPLEADDTEDSAPLWRWLSEAAGGDRLKFLADGFYSADWNDELLTAQKKEILARLERGEVDLILAFGTAAGEALITDEHQTPLMLLSATDPVSAGLSLSAEDSGRDNVHAQVAVGYVDYQLAMFHNLFGFATLGVPYDSTPTGRNTMALPAVERVAAERGFKILPCVADLEIEDGNQSFANLKNCLEVLAAQSEAVYLPVNNGLQHERMAELLAPIIAHKRPSFSQLGPEETRLGVLMSLGETDFQGSGYFGAATVKAILDGRKPREVKQVYLAPLSMALNLKMGRLIGWHPPFEVLAAVDELFNQVVGYE